jgi:serine phosphatase RsbU (regulator of sigma subunit)
MAGNAYLNIAAQNKGIADPGELLHELDRNITHSLQQGQHDSKDGMDIAVCAWHPQRGTLSMSGARGNIIYISKGEVHQLKGSRSTIGGHGEADKKEFPTHTIDIEAPTAVYMFSDGFADQFGGSEYRKYMSRRFRDLLFGIHGLAPEAQAAKLEEELSAWMGEHKQIDDILVIGLMLPGASK